MANLKYNLVLEWGFRGGKKKNNLWEVRENVKYQTGGGRKGGSKVCSRGNPRVFLLNIKVKSSL